MKAKAGDRVEFIVTIMHDFDEIPIKISGTVVGDWVDAHDIRIDSQFSSKETVVYVKAYDICSVLEKRCTCEIQSLMYRGCKCGAMKRE